MENLVEQIVSNFYFRFHSYNSFFIHLLFSFLISLSNISITIHTDATIEWLLRLFRDVQTHIHQTISTATASCLLASSYWEGIISQFFTIAPNRDKFTRLIWRKTLIFLTRLKFYVCSVSLVIVSWDGNYANLMTLPGQWCVHFRLKSCRIICGILLRESPRWDNTLNLGGNSQKNFHINWFEVLLSNKFSKTLSIILIMKVGFWWIII